MQCFHGLHTIQNMDSVALKDSGQNRSDLVKIIKVGRLNNTSKIVLNCFLCDLGLLFTIFGFFFWFLKKSHGLLRNLPQNHVPIWYS